jgi:hypothetical protein
MFDRFSLGETRTEYVPYAKTVIEKRAPTDESIRIYEEIKEKAYSSILDSIVMNDNTLNVKAIVYTDLHTASKICQYAVMLNGREIKGKVKADEFKHTDKMALLRDIVDQASKQIAIEIGKSLFNAGLG